MESNLTKEKIIEMIIENTDIRGIDLRFYKSNFDDVADKISKLIKGETVTYYDFEKSQHVELKP